MGEELNSARMTSRGLFGDRAFALCDKETRKVVSAENPKKWPNLFSYRAAFVDPTGDSGDLPAVRVTLPDGRFTVTGSAEFNPLLSEALGRSVDLLEAPPVDAQLEEYWPDMPELAHQNAVTDEALPAGTFFDLATLHVLTTGTLDRLRELYPGGRFEPRRFRPNLIINTGEKKGFVENDWIGRTLKIGPRGADSGNGSMSAMRDDDARAGRPAQRIREFSERRHSTTKCTVGIYASVVRQGTVRLGDAVTMS